MKASTKLKSALQENKVLYLPGAYDGLSAKIAENEGARAIYATGGGIARSTGVPDMGLLSLDEIAHRLEQMVDAVEIPIVADMDTGYGNALNARRALRAFERAGVAGFHIEDQVFPKKCGHYENKSVVAAEEFYSKIRAVRDAVSDEDILLIARTDALAVHGIDEAINRMHRAIEAGANMVFVEAPTTMAEIEQIAKELPYPKMLNMFWSGKTPVLDTKQLEALGFDMVIVPSDLQRIAIAAMSRAAREIINFGHTKELANQMATFQEREAAINSEFFNELDKRYSIG
ncbi:MAG: oxaloacetate decarboxylase [Alphaproteobacteria bacterium]|nr:oxaloacetate decarboxylase [Alphaproteobacteria bacterium]NBT41468.1 oxaloacetate decarboxylase [Alphaproteobacteria bacterium]